MMNWFNNLFSWNKPAMPAASSTPRDPEAPIKGLVANAPKLGGQAGENARMRQELLGSMKKGGHIKKTGVYKLHKGEVVIPEKKAKIARKMLHEDESEEATRQYYSHHGHI